MDDILLANETWQGHLSTIEDTLHTLEINELTCNPSKCMFGMTKLEFLVFVISREGIKISRQTLAAIEKIAPPKNRKSLQRILGLINLWRKFVPQFSQNTYHMRKLLGKDVAFVWSSQCEKSCNI